MTTIIIANYWALENETFIDKDQIILELYNDTYHQCIRILDKDKIIQSFTID